MVLSVEVVEKVEIGSEEMSVVKSSFDEAIAGASHRSCDLDVFWIESSVFFSEELAGYG